MVDVVFATERPDHDSHEFRNRDASAGPVRELPIEPASRAIRLTRIYRDVRKLPPPTAPSDSADAFFSESEELDVPSRKDFSLTLLRHVR